MNLIIKIFKYMTFLKIGLLFPNVADKTLGLQWNEGQFNTV